MAKTDSVNKNDKKEAQKGKTKDESGQKKENNKSGKSRDKKETEYKPGMSYLYDPCPHRVWTPKPGERDKSEPRGVGSPWYEPVKKKEEVDKEEAEKKKEKEEKAQKKRQGAYEERQKAKEEEEKKKKEEEKKKEEKEKKKEEKKKKREKEKKKKEDEKRKQQQEQREKEKEKKKQEEETKSKEKKDKEAREKKKKKEEPQASYMYEPCPHRVYTPAPGAKDMADPRGVGSPWYVPVKKKEDIDKEEEEEREQEKQKMKEKRNKKQKEKKEEEKRVEEERLKEEKAMKKEEKKAQAREEKRRQEIERRRQEREKEEFEHEEMGSGVRKSRTDFTPELILMLDFITDVDEKERERRGEALRWRKQEIEAEIESHSAKEAFTNDFKEFVNTFVEAEWGRADKKLRILKKEEKRKRKKLLENMDPLAKDLLAEGKRFKTLYKAATGERSGSGEGRPSAMEDMVVSKIMQQMDKLDKSDGYSGNNVSKVKLMLSKMC